MNPMTISVIIVSYNTKELLSNCVASVCSSVANCEYEIIVVDNSSSDGSAAMLAEQFPDVKLLSNSYNAGFARANNQGYAISRGKYILLLNSDTIVKGDAIARMIQCLEVQPSIGIVGPRLLNSDLTLQAQCRRGFPRLVNSLGYITGLSRIFPKSSHLGGYLMTHIDDKMSHNVDAVSGACMLLRRSIIKEIGGLLDEAFFMHFEDVDLCYRSKEFGYGVWYLHDAEVIHLKGRSSLFRAKGVKQDFCNSALIYLAKNYRKESWFGYLVLSAGVRFIRRLRG